MRAHPPEGFPGLKSPVVLLLQAVVGSEPFRILQLLQKHAGKCRTCYATVRSLKICSASICSAQSARPKDLHCSWLHLATEPVPWLDIHKVPAVAQGRAPRVCRLAGSDG